MEVLTIFQKRKPCTVDRLLFTFYMHYFKFLELTYSYELELASCGGSIVCDPGDPGLHAGDL